MNREQKGSMGRITGKIGDTPVSSIVISDHRAIDDQGWELFFNVLKGRSQVLDLDRAKEEVTRYRQFIKNVATDYDCDADSHKYHGGFGCRKCKATKLLL